MLIRQSVIYLFARLVPAAIAFGLIALYTRLLSPEDYGLLAFVTATVGLAFSLAGTWLCTAAVRFGTRDQPGEGVRWSLAVGYGAVALVGLVVAIAVALTVRSPEERIFLALGYALFVLTVWFELNADLLTAQLKPGAYLRMSLLRTGLGGALGAMLALFGFGVAGILVGTLIGLAVPAVFMTHRHWAGLALRPAHPGALKALLHFGLPLSLSFGTTAIVYTTDRYIVSFFEGAAALGLYAVGFDLADRIIKSITLPLGTASLPLLITRFEREGKAAAIAQARQNFAVLAGVAVPACVGLMVVTPELTAVMVGADYRAMCAQVLPVVALTALLGSLRGQYFDHAFHLGLRTRRQALVVALMAGVNLVAGLIFVRTMGVMGVAYGTLLAYGVGVAGSIMIGRAAFPMPLMPGVLGRIIVAALAMAAVTLAVDVTDPALALVLKVVTGALTYVGLILILDVGGVRAEILDRLPRFLTPWRTSP